MITLCLLKGLTKNKKNLASICRAKFCSNSNNGDNEKDQNKNEVYIHKQNYNQEQSKSYTLRLEQALARKKEKDEIQVKILSGDVKIIPRRKRRIYDRPKHDLNIENYHVWRSWDRVMIKSVPKSIKIACKIPLVPALLKKVSFDLINKNNE